MASSPFTDDAIRAKLSSLNETQESITAVSQWMMFYRKQADRGVQVWMQKIKDSQPHKKLSLIYLANEIAQQCRIRKRDEFLKSFLTVIVEATAAAYKGSPADIQNKIRRVVEVWRQRQVFDTEKQSQIEAALNDIDRSRQSRKPALGGSLFANSSSVPPELATVAPLATSVQKAEMGAKPAIATANQEYEKLTSPNYSIPTAPVHAAGLAALVRKLQSAEGAVAESIKARQALVKGLEQLLASNKVKLNSEEAQMNDLKIKEIAIDGRKREVEESILKGLPPADQHAISAAPLSVNSSARNTPPARPDIEELTPPPMESFTPVGSPERDLPYVPDDVLPEPVAHPVEPIAVPPANGEASIFSPPVTAIGMPNNHAEADIVALREHHQPLGHGGTFKKRKLSRSATDDEFAAFAGDGDIEGIDASLDGLI